MPIDCSGPLVTMLVICLALPVAAGAMREKSKKPALSVHLEFVPQGVDREASVALPGSLIDRSVAIRVEDSRKLEDALVLGQGTDNEDRFFPIRATNDVIDFVDDAVAEMAGSQALKTSSPTDRQLELRLTRFNASEGNKAVGSTYSAEVHFAFTLRSASGESLAEGASTGTASRYGRARSSENCAEVLSDALRQAFTRILGDQKLQSAWISGQPSSSAESAPPSNATGAADAGTVEERLKKLDDLLRRGVITEEEHRAARAEILKSL